MEKDSTNGQMAGCTMESGKTMICMDLAYMSMLMESGMKVSMLMTRSQDLAFTTGQMAACLKANGSTANNMALVSSRSATKENPMACGKTENKSKCIKLTPSTKSKSANTILSMISMTHNAKTE